MNFETDVADKEFRANLRAFLSSRLQELFGGDVSGRILEPECRRRWSRALAGGESPPDRYDRDWFRRAHVM
jgi:hypothetical protein